MKNTKEAKNFTSLINALDNFISQKIKTINTFLPVKILAVNDTMVDVQVLLQMITADNRAFPGPKIFNCPFLTYSAGKNAFLLKPEVDDIGLMGFVQRDISKIVATKGSENIPGSLRHFSLSDGIYLGSLLFNPDKINNYIELAEGGILIKAEKEIGLEAQENIIVTSQKEMSLSAQTMEIKTQQEMNLEAGQKITFAAAGANFAGILKEVLESIIQSAAQPAAPGKPVIDPATVTQLMIKLAQLQNFGA